jgi:hypothetical protein
VVITAKLLDSAADRSRVILGYACNAPTIRCVGISLVTDTPPPMRPLQPGLPLPVRSSSPPVTCGGFDPAVAFVIALVVGYHAVRLLGVITTALRAPSPPSVGTNPLRHMTAQ